MHHRDLDQQPARPGDRYDAAVAEGQVVVAELEARAATSAMSAIPNRFYSLSPEPTTSV